MRALGFVQLPGQSQCIEDLLGHPAQVAPLPADVVVQTRATAKSRLRGRGRSSRQIAVRTVNDLLRVLPRVTAPPSASAAVRRVGGHAGAERRERLRLRGDGDDVCESLGVLWKQVPVALVAICGSLPLPYEVCMGGV